VGTPVITQLATGELLLAKDNIGIVIGADGKPLRKVCWHVCGNDWK
jgi:hypothetical protein